MTVGADDVIELRDLRVSALCGVLPEEIVRRQPFAFDIDVHVGLSEATVSDDLADTVDYGSLCGLVSGIADDERFSLLERFAGRVAEALLAVDRVEAVTVTVRKLRPPVAEALGTSGVRIHRRA